MDSLTYKQLLDFTIGVLYELRVKQKRTGYYSLNEIIKYFNYEVSFDEIRDIAKYLEAQGYVKTVFIYGDVFLELTTRGIIYFEAKDKAFFTSFDAFRKARQKEKIKDTVEQLDKKIMASSKENLVKEIQDFKKLNDKNQYTDYLSDIDILIIELQKDNPDKEILAHKTNKLLENLNFRDKLSKIVSKLNIE
jgi:hypothetical protein